MINWRLRFRNKVTLVALVGLTVAFIYQLLGVIGIVPSVSEDDVKNLCMLLIDILVGIGIVVDPTTAGLSDSSRAMAYEEPSCDDSDPDDEIIEEDGSDEDPDEDEVLPQ